MLGVGKGYALVESRISYLRAMTTATGPVRAEGVVTVFGLDRHIADGRLIDRAGRAYAHATVTCVSFSV